MKKETVWVVTKEYNCYDQYGAYFVKVYKEQPTHQQCLNLLLEENYMTKDQDKKHQDKMAALLMKGGGRYKWEDEWYNLFEEELA